MDKRVWKEPKKAKELDQSQSPLWFWNDALETEEIKRQLEMQSEAGVACTIPHARTNGGEGFIGGYLDEEWFGHIETVLSYKRKKKEPVWMYDEIDWPAGTCNQTITQKERYREQYITFETIEIPAGQPFRAQLRELTGKGKFSIKPEDDMSQYGFNIFVVDKETGQPYRTPDYFTYLRFGPEFQFQSDRDAVCYIASIHVEAYEHGGNLMVNYLDGEATKTFLASTYDKYYERFSEDFGSTIQCFFNDETRMCNALPWSRKFPEEFKKRKGYDIMPKLYHLILPGKEAGRTRCDYFDVVAALFQKNYFGELHQWCEAHHVKLFAHLLGEETLFGHARYSGDYLRQNKHLDIPGADHLGKGIGSLNIKFTSCGAHSYGKEMTAVEVFAGCGWDMTFEEYIRMITWMYQQGMQIIINHGFFYSDRGNRKNDWPPSQFFQWQGWDRMPEGNDMVRRLHYAMTGGYNEADILVYHPMETFLLHYLPDTRFTHGFFQGAFLQNDRAQIMDKEIQLLLNGLSSENLDFDLCHQDALDNFAVRDGKVVNVLNGQSFSVMVLPMCEMVPLDCARLCESFAREGGKIIALDSLPVMGTKPEEDKEVTEIFEKLYAKEKLIKLPVGNKEKLYQILRESTPMPVEIVKGTGKTVNNHPCYEQYLIDPYIHTDEDLTGVLFNRYIRDGKRNTLFMNYSNKPEVVQVKVTSKGDAPAVWDTFTGEIKECTVIEKTKEAYIVEVELPCNYGVILVSDI